MSRYDGMDSTPVPPDWYRTVFHLGKERWLPTIKSYTKFLDCLFANMKAPPPKDILGAEGVPIESLLCSSHEAGLGCRLLYDPSRFCWCDGSSNFVFEIDELRTRFKLATLRDPNQDMVIEKLFQA